MRTKLCIAVVLLFVEIMVSAHDFSTTVNGQRLYFDITSKTRRTVSVTYNGNIKDKNVPTLSGIIEIPARVRHDSVVYEVSGIGSKAFAYAPQLKGVVIPSGVKSIGDFAFEGCDSLQSVIFPGNPVSLGQGIFFRCSKISDVTIGSDWKSVDLTMFRWSENLTSVFIPAKIGKIQGIKKLKHLTSIAVDPNNRLFSSSNGMLYSKDGKILYACPRAYMNKVLVNEGTEKIQSGALIDCVNVTYIDFPSTLMSVSFRETSRMVNLNTIVVRAVLPINIGYINGSGKFLFRLRNPDVDIVVLSTSKDKYINMLATDAGEYSESEDGVPYTIDIRELPTNKNFKGVKNFNKY